MADAVTSAFGPLTSAFTQATTQGSSSGSMSGWIIGISFFGGLAIIATIVAFVWVFWSEKRKWNIKTRVHYENPAINGVSLGDTVLTKRVRFKDGRVVYMYKTPIQGYTISPELLTWSKPREHDVIVTQDKKLFCLVGISSIDAKRKLLNVDISYPDIEMDRQDLQKHVDSKKYDDPNEKFKIIAKLAAWILFGIFIVVMLILGSKAYVDGKNADAQRDQINLQTAQYQAKSAEQMNTFILILSKVMPQSFQSIDGQDLLNQTIQEYKAQ